MNKQQLASKIWESANKMRSKIEANEYKDYILGFIFYKFLSETEVTRLKARDFAEEDLPSLVEDDEETVEFVKGECGYFIAYENLFSTWVAKGGDFEISNVRDALSAFSRNIDPARKRVFDGIFDTLQTGLSKLGTDARSQSKAARDLIYLIKDIPMDGRQDYDVLGFIYEYLISNFAANAGKKAGEFYTPHEVSMLMSEIISWHLAGRENITIYDPTSGSGSLLINIGKAVARRNGDPDSIKYYAQELKENTYNLTRMNLVMRGILPDNIVARNGDTLEDDWPWFDTVENKDETYDPLFVDAVVSNPPYSQNWDPEDKELDPRFKFGVAPKSKADYAFLLHDLYHLRPDGIMCIVLPHGVLFRGGDEGTIRKNLVEYRHIQAIIGLPANIFFGTGIPTIIMVLRQKRDESDVLIIDASKDFEKVGKNNQLRSSDIRRIVDTVTARRTIEGYSRLVGKDEIRANDYNLNIPRYVDSSEPTETWDLYASMFGGIPVQEIDALSKYWEALPGLREALFTANNGHCARMACEDVADAIQGNEAVEGYVARYHAEFSGLRRQLVATLIGNWQRVDAPSAEAAVADEVFKLVEPFTLVDKYDAYQALDDAWGVIAADLEMLQTEGFDAARKVDPEYVIKKKSGKDVEVQDGWKGHILPFSLVQDALLSVEAEQLRDLQDEMSHLNGECESLQEELPCEDAEEGDADDSCDLTEEEIAAKRNELAALQKKLKSLKKDAKAQESALEEKTRETIEALTDEQVYELLEAKWVEPLMDDLNALPQVSIEGLIKKVNALEEKYKDTYADVAEQISEAERELDAMLGQLVGDEFDMLGIAELRKLLGGE